MQKMICKVNIIYSKKEKITTKGIFRVKAGAYWEAPLGRHLPWLRAVRDVAHTATVKQHPPVHSPLDACYDSVEDHP
jgi:hypothetical protein